MGDILKNEILNSGAHVVLEGNRIVIYSPAISATFSEKDDAARYISQLEGKCQIDIYGPVRIELDNLIAKYRTAENEKNIAVLVQDYSPANVAYKTPTVWNNLKAKTERKRKQEVTLPIRIRVGKKNVSNVAKALVTHIIKKKK
ncbi:hypothetical protein JXB27_03040 [Candidatus Woesearchaeota archaeon]|nr:hypothetical protein [Candidatus Woesearchaeota archaeon]